MVRNVVWRRPVLLALVAGALCAVLPAAAAAKVHHAKARHHHRRAHHKHRGVTNPDVRSVPVSFTVVNDNALSSAFCLPAGADGKTYTISGSLFLPPGDVPTGVTLYVHGLGYARWFWDFTAVPGYDYAGAEAAAGHASVVIDRLGYGDSSIPAGTAMCVGSQATILHEIIHDLRAGSYTQTGLASAPAFTRVGLVGHSAGGELAEIEAYSFHDINALGVMDWADQLYSLGAYSAFASDTLQCVQGNVKQVGSSSSGYATFGTADTQFDSLMLADADPAVRKAVNAMRTNDPCGQIESILGGSVLDIANAASIKVPIAYVHGGEDGIFQAGLPWPSFQEGLFKGSSRLTDIGLPGEGHAVTLERGAPRLEAAMSAWLTANGL
jgi:pimeloyl-ACP methyl ester carboxylesterase